MRGPRRPEDLPRLMAALGVDAAGVRSALGPGQPSAREEEGLKRLLPPALPEPGPGSPEPWVPTPTSLAHATRSVGRSRSAASTTAVDQSPRLVEGNLQVTTVVASALPAGRHRRHRRGPPVAAPPAVLREARYAVSRRAVLAVLLVALLAVALFVARVELARAAGQPSPVVSSTGTSGAGAIVARASSAFGPWTPGPPTATAAGRGSAPAAGSGRASGSAGAAGPVVVVHVVGQVRKPGVYTLAAGRRVTDAVAAAGGATTRADLGAVNLARPLVDGEQIRVPQPGEVVASVPEPAGAAGGSPGAGQGGGLVNLNSADLAALDTLPGVGPVLAQRILDWRSAHGSFTSIQELGEVTGIGEKMLAQLTPKVSL